MSEENVQTVKALFAAWQERDPRAALEHIDPDIEFDFNNVAALGEEWGADRGFEALQGRIGAWFEIFESMEWFPQHFIDHGDHVIVLLRGKAQGRESRVPVEIRITVVYTLHNGLIVGFRGYDTLAAAAAAIEV